MSEFNLQIKKAINLTNSGLWREGCIVACFSILAVSVVMQFYLLVAVPDVLRTLFDLTTIQARNLTTIFGFFYAIGLLIWGRLASLFRSKTIMILGLFLLCGISLALMVTKQYPWLLGMRSAQGFVAAAFPPAAILWLSENISVSRRVVAIAFTSCGFLLSASLGQWFGAAFINSSLMLVMGISALVYAAGFIIFSFLPLTALKQPQQPQSFLRELLQISKQRDASKVYILAFFLFNSLIVFYSSITGELLPALLEHGINPAWFRIVAIPGLMISLFTPLFITRFGSLYMVWFSTFLLAIGHALQLLASVIPGIWMYVAHIVYVAGIGFAVPSLINFIGFSMPTQIKGAAISLYMFILFLGGGAGSLFISYIGVVYMITAQICVFALIALWLGRDLLKRRKCGLPLTVLAVSFSSFAAGNTAFASQDPLIEKKILEYFKELAPSESQHYVSRWIASGKKVSGKVKTENITLYRWQHESNLALGYDHVSIQVTDKGELSGFARYIPSAAVEPLPSKEGAEKIAREFLQKYAPDLLPVMDIQWIGQHRDETYTDGNATYRINGMKVKSRNTMDGTYFWIIVGSDKTVIVFERDIEWDFIRAGRQTEKWLHDDWLQKNKIKFARD